jgi:hypothetical protein
MNSEDWDDDYEGGWDNDEHPYECDCDECRRQHLEDECGRLPEDIGGGCQLAGTEHCDFECPFRDTIFGG